MPSVAVDILLAGLFDDAGMFPPARLPIADAISRHRADRERAHPVLSGRFIAPASALGDVAAQSGGGLEVVVVGDLDVDELVEAMEKAVADGSTVIRGVELRPLDASWIAPAAEALKDFGEVYVELPRSDTWRDVVRAAADADVAVKVRCGGAAAEHFPTPALLAEWLTTAFGARLPVKATAGLHHAVRRVDPVTGIAHHGFLNLLLAALRALAGDGGVAVEAELTETSTSAVLDAVHALTEKEAADIRAAVHGIGTCSTSEPIEDLVALGLTTR